MTCMRVTIRKPPRCDRCLGSGWRLNGLACDKCMGLSAQVEYFFEYGPLFHTKAFWEIWEDDDAPIPEPSHLAARSRRRSSLHAP